MCFCVNIGASKWLKEWWSDFPGAASLWFHCCLSLYTQWERPVWFWLPPAPSSVLCVCVGLLCPGLFHMCLTLLWQGCPASQGRWRMSETRAEKRTASQHLMEWETHSLDGWPADATAWEQSRGWRPSKTPNVCVKYHSFSLLLIHSPTCAHIHSDSQE